MGRVLASTGVNGLEEDSSSHGQGARTESSFAARVTRLTRLLVITYFETGRGADLHMGGVRCGVRPSRTPPSDVFMDSGGLSIPRDVLKPEALVKKLAAVPFACASGFNGSHEKAKKRAERCGAAKLGDDAFSDLRERRNDGGTQNKTDEGSRIDPRS